MSVSKAGSPIELSTMTRLFFSALSNTAATCQHVAFEQLSWSWRNRETEVVIALKFNEVIFRLRQPHVASSCHELDSTGLSKHMC